MRDEHCTMYQNKKEKKEKKRIKIKRKVKKEGEKAIFLGEAKTVQRSELERKREKRGVEREIFSLRSMEIGLSVFVGARGKVDPRIESYAWIPKSWSFVKLHEVGNFPT